MKPDTKMDLDRLALLAGEALNAAAQRFLCDDRPPRWATRPVPYLRAIRNKDYGLEYPDMAVARALDLLQSWRGPNARRVKAAMLEELEKDSRV